jgi:MFS family permease
VVGAALVSVGAAGIIMMLQAAASGPWVAMCGAVLTTLAAPLVILRSKGRPDGFLPASVLLHGGLVRICLVAGTVPAAWFALLVAVPARLSELGWSPLGVGAALLPSAATALVSPVLARHLADRLGSRGALTVAAALSSLALLVGGLGAVSASAPVMVAGVAVVSGAFGIGQPALFALVADLAAPDLRGVASGFASLVFMGCGSAGAAVVGGLGGVTSLATALLVLSAVCALGCLAAHSVTRRQGELTHSVVPSAKT